MAAVLAAASYSRIGFSIYFAVRARHVRVPGGSKFHLEPGTIRRSVSHSCGNMGIDSYIFVCLGSPIFSAYSLNFENQYFISNVKFYIIVRFILFSISHIFILIYCYGFYFDILGFFNPIIEQILF